MTDRKNQEPCRYCCKSYYASPIISGWGGEARIDGRRLFIMLNNGHGGVGSTENGPIRFCPMCGREL